MIIELTVALIVGIFAGTFTGLAPGIHINLIGAMLVAFSASLLAPIDSTYLVVFIVSMSITHSFVDFIPSIFLGCPNDDTSLSVLPGHEMLKKGRGHAAVLLTAYGCLTATILTILISYPLIITVKKIYPLIQTSIPYILITVSIIMIFSEKRKISSMTVYFITGILGLIILNLDRLEEPLLPLLSGLFGASSLIISIKNKIHIPKQTLEIERPELTKPIIASLIASPLCGFLPGLGSGQAAILGNVISRADRRGFLVLQGATSTLVMAFSFLSLYAISKTRTGSAAAIKDLIGQPSPQILIIILASVLISGVISFFITKKLSALFSQNINKINYSKLSIATTILLTIVVIIFSGPLGFLTFTISTFTGIYCIQTGVKRTNMMACLLLPTIVLYLF